MRRRQKQRGRKKKRREERMRREANIAWVKLEKKERKGGIRKGMKEGEMNEPRNTEKGRGRNR